MADGEGEPDLGVGDDKKKMPLELVQRLHKALRGLEARLRDQAPSEAGSVSYCKRFCQTMLEFAGDQNFSKDALPFLEVYQTFTQYFVRACPFLTVECEEVPVVLGKLVLSCFELLLSVPESELVCEEWSKFQQSIQASHKELLEFGYNNFQALVVATKEGGVWKRPIIINILNQQKIESEEVSEFIAQEGTSFLELRIKHLMKSNCIQQAMILAKLCAESSESSNAKCFRQSYITCLCSTLPNEDAIKEISKVDCREVLDIICNLETEGRDNTAFILCTTYLTQQIQTENIDCSWELTLFWSKLHRRIEPSLDTFLERCRQFGVIAKTLQHLFFLIRVVHAEAEEEGLAISILLCVRALQIKSDENGMKSSVCKTIACLLSHDLEVRRACQLTEFLLDPSEATYNVLESLHLQPDQKFDEENAIVPNSLRCELLLALKAHWPFDPEFWDWKTLNRHCLKLLGKEASESEEHESSEMVENNINVVEPSSSDMDQVNEQQHLHEESLLDEVKEAKIKKQVSIKKPVGSSERYQRWLQYKFHCLLCNREVIEARILHHAKMHLEDGIYTCPVCIKKFKKKEVFVPHVMEHVKMPSRHRPRKKRMQKEKMNLLRNGKPPAISFTSPEQNNHLSKQMYDQYVTFRQLEDYNLQDRDLHPCPGTNCSRIFKQFKYLSVHLKAEHQNNDENAKHYLDIKNRREKCGFCRRHFITEFHLQDHEQVHVGPQPFMCVSIDCFAKFSSVNELLGHKQMHEELEYKCELKGCNIVFSDLGQLYHHEAQHFRDASYACSYAGCKKFYFSKIEFQTHLTTHEVNDAKALNQEKRKAEELAITQQEHKPCLIKLNDELDTKQSSSVLESLVLSTESSKSQIISEIKVEHSADTNSEGEACHPTPLEKQETFVEKASLCEMEAQLDDSQNKNILDVRGSNNKFFVSNRLKEQFSFFSVTFDGKKFTCGFDGCGVSRKNTRGMHTHLRNDHPNLFKPKKRTGINARNFRQLFSGSQKSKLVRKLGARQELSDKRDTFKRRLVCHANSRMQRILKGEICQPIARARTLSSLPRVRRTEDAMVELLLRLKNLSLTNATPLIHSSTSLQKPLSETFQSFPSTCVTSPDLEVGNKVSQRTAAEQEAFTNQCLLRLAAKPFFCELQGCKYAFVTRDALLVHYLRKHNFPKEAVLKFSMFKDKYAPFQCHICHRAFTRRTHLRIHYRTKHQLGKVKLPKMLFSTKKCGLNMGLQGSTENILNRSTNTCSTTAFRLSEGEEFDDEDDDNDMFEQGMKPDLSHFKKGENCSETDTMSDEIDPLEDSPEEDFELGEMRESKRTVAKGDLGYISDRCHKPFHCVHKGCNSSFTSRPALFRHYRIVHHYSKEQLSLEKGKAKSKRDLAKYKKIFVCKYQDCNKRFLCSEALAKHCSDVHNLYNGDDQTFLAVTESARFSCDQPKCPAVFYTFEKLKHHQMEDHHTEVLQNKELEIRCELNGCYRLFSHNTAYTEHVYHSHRERYDDIFGKPGEVKGTVLEGNSFVGHKKPNLVREKCQFPTDRNKMKKVERQFVKRNDKKFEAVDFRAREEAVNMCLEEVKHTQFPCMVHGCLSVVKLESSIVRHYKRSHLFSDGYIEKHYHKLVLCVKYGMRDEGESHIEIRAKKHYMQGSKRRKKCVIESGRQLIKNDFHYQDKENENYSRNAVGNDLFDSDAFLCKSMLKYNHNSNSASFEDCKIEQNQPESSEREHKSYFSSYPLPLNRKNESDDWERSSAHREDSRFTVHAGKDNCQKQSLNRTFDIKSFKPMGFESSFLKFIQEREQKDDYFEDQAEWVPEKYCAPSIVKNTKDNLNNFEHFQGGRKPKSASDPLFHGHVTTCNPLASASVSATAPSLEDLRAILDKALTDCGDLALKQLRYQRPVVVLERSKFSSPLVDLFPAKKTERLCVGST